MGLFKQLDQVMVAIIYLSMTFFGDIMPLFAIVLLQRWNFKKID